MRSLNKPASICTCGHTGDGPGKALGRQEIIDRLANLRDEYGIRLTTRLSHTEVFLDKDGQTTFFRKKGGK